MQLCKTCRSLMIGQEAARSFPRLEQLLATSWRRCRDASSRGGITRTDVRQMPEGHG